MVAVAVAAFWMLSRPAANAVDADLVAPRGENAPVENDDLEHVRGLKEAAAATTSGGH